MRVTSGRFVLVGLVGLAGLSACVGAPPGGGGSPGNGGDSEPDAGDSQPGSDTDDPGSGGDSTTPGDPGSGGDSATPGDTDPVDPTEAAFATDHLLEVAIEMDPADWDALRQQTRSIDDIFGTNCLAPRERPFTYFPADVTLDGTRMQVVGVRKKGFLGSLDNVKPSLKIKLNEYVGGQKWRGLKRLTFNNCRQDPSYVKQCVGYELFAQVGVPAPRCGFAHVTVNGNDLGVFAHVESIETEFLARHFPDARGNLYEGALSDFRPEWIDTFERKTNEEILDRSDLEALVPVVELPDDQLLATLEPLVPVDAFMDFWAAEVLLAHWDGYAGNTNNFYLYFDPRSGAATFIPWGIDGILQDDPNLPAQAVLARGALARRLYLLPETRDLYLARLRAFTESAWDPRALITRIDAFEALIRPVADPLGSDDLAGKVQAVRNFVRERQARVLAVLDAGAPPWDEPLRNPPCMVAIGTITGSFDTVWGTVGTPDPFATGAGTLTATVGGNVIVPDATTSTAGPDPNTPPEAREHAIQIIGAFANGDVAVVHVVVYDLALLGPGISIPFDFVSSAAIVFYYTKATDQFAVVGFLLDGGVQLDAAAMVDGSPVQGSLQGELRNWAP